MSFLALAALALLLLVVIAFAARVYVKSRQAQERAASNRDPNERRYDSTLGELRDLREALGPLASKPNQPASSAVGGKETAASPRQPARSAR